MTETNTPAPGPDHDPRPDDTDAREEGYRVKAGGFEGPLDLLLHLVRVNEVDITDIPILEITAQYNAYLDLMREMNLEIAGEYLVMAATLVHIKSRMLLPPDPGDEAESEQEDPRAELAQQLLEYQRYKQAAETLGAMDSRRTLIWTREGQIPEEFEGEEWLTADLFDLMSSFRKLLSRLGEEAKLHLRRERVSVAEKIAWLTEMLEERGSVRFQQALESLPGLADRIAAFLGLLEMVRLGMVVALQHREHGEIRLALRQSVPAEGPPEIDGEESDA